MPKLIFSISVFLFGFAASILAQQEKSFPKTGKTVKQFLKGGWFEIGRGKADFNNDGKTDLALAVEYAKEGDDEDGKRALIILFKDSNGYVLSKVNYEALMDKNDGGMLGDPFQGITVKNNTFKISHYGGTAWRWGFDAQFRFQNKDWFLIGEKSYDYNNVNYCDSLKDNGSSHITDINYLTGRKYVKEISDDCVLKKDGWEKIKIEALKKFTDYTANN